MGRNWEYFEDCTSRMERLHIKPTDRDGIYLGMVACFLARIADSLEKEDKECEEGRQRPETDISNSCTG